MPELPEVEVVRRGLAAALIGRTIASAELIGAHGPRAVRRHAPGPEDFVISLTGRRVTDVRRRGKYLWCALDDGAALLAHLGMSGQFRVYDGDLGSLRAVAVDGASGPLPPGIRYDESPHPHTRVRVRCAGDGPVVDFLDQRTFGGLRVVPGGAELPAPIAHLGRDVMDSDFDAEAAVRAIRGKRSAIKRVLLDQTVISGIGNIYADEALWAARVHYDRVARTLAPRTIRAVIEATRTVMREALAAGGTSFDALYVNVNGRSGYFERSLNVYGREGTPCPRCGAVIRRDRWTNRSSFYCPRCQRRA